MEGHYEALEVTPWACCHDDHCSTAKPLLDSPRWRRALWIALAVNAGFFLTEAAAGAAAGSAALQARRARLPRRCRELRDQLRRGRDGGRLAVAATLAKVRNHDRLAMWVLGSTAWHAWFGTLPRAEVMGVVGLAALLANSGVALMLYRYRARPY